MIMERPIIEIKGISKKYRIAHRRGGYVALRDVLTNFFRHPLRVMRDKLSQEDLWALKDVDLSIKKGETVGIIGRNGAGKSTLLKILSQITPPTEGEVRIRGKVASLLEVGTGFHPELTGRENIYLNGAILGMPREEIARKFESIVTFAGIERFLDTPVRFYSSGMYVRLAFSVAAHLEPDILIVDEVLAVGDAEFQKKCLGKMDEAMKEEGRTILFVSHNLAAVQALCGKCVLLEEGKVVMYDETHKVIDRYLSNADARRAVSVFNEEKEKRAQITKVTLLAKANEPATQLPITEDMFIDVEYVIREDIDRALLCAFFFDAGGDLFLLSSETDAAPALKTYTKGRYRTRIRVPARLFNIGFYRVSVSLQRPFVEYIDLRENIEFEVIDAPGFRIEERWKPMGRTAALLDYETSSLEK